MKVCIFGAGAVGGHVAARLVAAQADDVALVARGATLDAIRTHGLTLRSGGAEIKAQPRTVTDDPASLPPQDVVIVALKAQSVPAAAPAIARLVAPGGAAVFLLNGVPWWWRAGLAGTPGPLPLLDPEARLWKEVRPERTIGCVVHSSNEIVGPGTIVHTGMNHFFFGAPDGAASPQLKAVMEVFTRGGMDARAPADLRREVLKKLVINAAGNPIAALARVDLGTIHTDPGLHALAVGIMGETIAVASAMGWDLAGEMDPEKIVAAGKPGLRTSMLQDVLLGRTIEVEAILGQLEAFAREHGVATPRIDAVLPLLRHLDRSLGRR